MRETVKNSFPTAVNWLKFFRLIRHPKLFRDYLNFRKSKRASFPKPRLYDVFLCLNDNTSTTEFDTHYIYHPAWAARIVKKLNPELHIDISSTLHFSTQLSAFIKTEFYDYRPAKLTLSNLTSGSADLCDLHFPDSSISSLSCMHTVEHIGLGRYGDPLDAQGDIKAINELQRVVKSGGSLLFVVPVGKEKIVFNANRIYSYSTIISLFNKMELIEFTLIPDNAIEIGILENASPDLVEKQKYGCGCFWFRKI